MGIVLLEVIAIALAVWGVVNLIHGQIATGILLLVLACVVGPGGYSIFV